MQGVVKAIYKNTCYLCTKNTGKLVMNRENTGNLILTRTWPPCSIHVGGGKSQFFE